MTADEVARAIAEPDGSASCSYGLWCVDVPPARWIVALHSARGEHALSYLDWLSAVDEGVAGFDVVAHLLDPARMLHLLVRTRLPAERPTVDSAVSVFRGAAWHERETAEMFGIDFVGHPDLAPLLLPDSFEGHPLRKDFVLAARVAKTWPGATEPGEPATGGRARRVPRAPGVPDPAVWGPDA